NSHVSPCARDNCSVNPHDFALHVDERPSRVSWVDGRICLHEVFVIGDAQVLPPLCADYAMGERGLKFKGASNCCYKFAHFYLVSVPKLQVGQRLAVDFDDGDIGMAIETDQGCCKDALIVQGDADLFRPLDDMRIRHDMALCRDKKARALRN